MISATSRRAGRLTALAVLAALAGCGGQVLAAGDVTVLVGERSRAGMDALGGGILEVVGGCLGAGGDVIVWPYGTEVVEEDPLTVDVPGVGRVELGEEVQVAGGFVLEHSSTDRSPGPFGVGGVTVPATCAEHDIFLARRGD